MARLVCPGLHGGRNRNILHLTSILMIYSPALSTSDMSGGIELLEGDFLFGIRSTTLVHASRKSKEKGEKRKRNKESKE